MVVNFYNRCKRLLVCSSFNVTHNRHTKIEELAKGKELIITNADKGRAVVILDTDSYLKEANLQLSDKASYGQTNNKNVKKREITS